MSKFSLVLCIAAIAGCKAKVTKVDDKAIDKALDQAMAAADKADKAPADKPDKPEPKAAGGGGAGAAEAQIMLHGLEKHVKEAFVEQAQFPAGKVGPTPATACCPKACAPSPDAWSDPVWKGLNFTIDEPSHFQYSYESDGKTFTATAVGDPDCSGTPVTVTLTGKNEAGNAVTSISGL